MKKLHLTSPCHFGLEKTLSFELKRAGGENLEVTDGRVNFTGTAETLVRANLSCSVAERVGVVLAQFRARTFDDVFENVQSIAIGEYLPVDGAFSVVKGQSVSSKLTSIPALQRTVKKALVQAMSRCHNASNLPETGALYPVRFFLHKDEMTVFLDSSGEGLHKRGYRAKSVTAPIKETLAAGIIDIAGFGRKGAVTLADPFCGSGTILIEAAFKALKIPPCLNRGFAAEHWGFIPREIWREQREILRSEIVQDSDFAAFGYDCDPEAVRLTLENARKAGVAEYIHAETRAIADFAYPESASTCTVITNPPYAERMLEREEARLIYRTMGEKLLPLGDNRLFVITSDEQFETLFGQKARRNRKLYNGMLMCRLYNYE
ncbi:MAG: class I SAM-dependent RNA methyltransferase [Oscillospiraceae bacterium]|nr:class I SAM-dependent RNA methyltransferase [Oscillospiraceae bacterium]